MAFHPLEGHGAAETETEGEAETETERPWQRPAEGRRDDESAEAA